MLYIVQKTHHTCWHVGESIPNINPFLVKELQADCDELEYLRQMFPTYPWNNDRVQVIYDEAAQKMFIKMLDK